jgi:hypothetical protein
MLRYLACRLLALTLVWCVLNDTRANADLLFVADYGPNGTGVGVSEVSATGQVSTYSDSAIAPTGQAFDASGNLFVAGGNGSNAIYKVTPSGAVSTFASGGGLAQPFGLAFDSLGNLYVANRGGGGSVSEITPTGTVSTLASGGLLNGNIYGVAVDSNNDVFASNFTAGTIIEITSGGAIGTFASGLGRPAYLAFEPAVAAPQPSSLVTVMIATAMIAVAWTACRWRCCLVAPQVFNPDSMKDANNKLVDQFTHGFSRPIPAGRRPVRTLLGSEVLEGRALLATLYAPVQVASVRTFSLPDTGPVNPAGANDASSYSLRLKGHNRRFNDIDPIYTHEGPIYDPVNNTAALYFTDRIPRGKLGQLTVSTSDGLNLTSNFVTVLKGKVPAKSK